MEEPRSLDNLFKEKIFRIPDFQRGYAWGKDQFKAFWEDLINLPDDRSHYTGVLTLKEIPAKTIKRNAKEYWLIDDHSYKMYYVVDGQQRLTTFIIFLQAFIEFIKQLPKYANLSDEKIYISESLSIDDVINKYLYKIKPTGNNFRTYKFGYTDDNPSYEYLRYKIFNEHGTGTIEETFYTLNLRNAKRYFLGQLKELYHQEELKGLRNIYKKLTTHFLFNEYIIKDEFDEFVAFETINNRGKDLSALELLKNRLIYLTTLYDDNDLDASERKSLREEVNNAWKEVYRQLGRNEKHPLNDDDFLQAHWIMYYKYSRETGKEFKKYLLNEKFTQQKVHKKGEQEVELDIPEEQRTNFELDSQENENDESDIELTQDKTASLKPKEISDYALSLKESVIHWFNSWYPHLADNLSADEIQALDRLNRVGMGYFRPLVMAILKNESEEANRLRIFSRIERFIFLVFRMTNTKSNYGNTEFYNAAREIEHGNGKLDDIENQLEKRLSFMFNKNGTLGYDFYNLLKKKFDEGRGYYGWYGLRYFLYEYELYLFSKSRQKKVEWEDLLKTSEDKISIEHIYPQTETKYWKQNFEKIPKEHRIYYQGSLGNLLLLSKSINSSLQNDSFEDKKNPKVNSLKQKIRNGYSDGSHSEIEVSQIPNWGPAQIKERGLTLLDFMSERWNFKFKNKNEKAELLFLNYK